MTEVATLDEGPTVELGQAVRRLWLLRHAKSSWADFSLADHDRPLAPRGKRDAERLGHWLAGLKHQPELVLCSTAERARKTLQRARRHWSIDDGSIRFESDLYHASGGSLLAQVRDTPEPVQDLMLVGHNPGLDELLIRLCGEPLPRTAKGKLLTTANVAIIDLAVAWEDLGPGCGSLRLLARPPR